MKIINIVDNATQVNTGIWNAAASTAKILKEIYNVDSEIWYPKMEVELYISFCTTVPLNNVKINSINDLIISRSLNPENTIVVTHGCWRYPTLWGNKFKSLGYKWIYVPHGMLEKWSLNQKKWLKYIYFKLIEKPKANKADIIRAVGSPEEKNLSQFFKCVKLIPNGVPMPDKENIEHKPVHPISFLFMARLHYKKGIVTLVEAWQKSKLNDHPGYVLTIAGPDHGELDKIMLLIKSSKNIKYIGMVNGQNKHNLLRESNYFILPSHSEGFPTSVVEAMSYGLIPYITHGCNFPEAFDSKTAIEISPEHNSIINQLNSILGFDNSNFKKQSQKNFHFILKNYSIDWIALQQFDLYKNLLSSI